MEILKIIPNENYTNTNKISSMQCSSVRRYIKTAQIIPNNSDNLVLLLHYSISYHPVQVLVRILILEKISRNHSLLECKYTLFNFLSMIAGEYKRSIKQLPSYLSSSEYRFFVILKNSALITFLPAVSQKSLLNIQNHHKYSLYHK